MENKNEVLNAQEIRDRIRTIEYTIIELRDYVDEALDLLDSITQDLKTFIIDKNDMAKTE